MPNSSVTSHQLGLEDVLKNYSCLICRQRKVKCDRRAPCSNCVKAEKQCSFIPPVRGKRKRTKPRKEGIHAKLKRYEELLKSYGANIEPSEEFDDSDTDTASQPDLETDKGAEIRSKPRNDPFGLEETKPRLITKEGMSSYFESAPWSNLGDESHHPEVGEVGGAGEPTDELTANESGMFLDPEFGNKFANLAELHPSPPILLKLKEIYLDRTDPLIKILHLPTFWSALTNGLRSPRDMSKSLEALVFAFYFATVNALKGDECESLFGTSQPTTYSRYRFATRQALVNAGFLSTSNPMTLQAYTMFIMSVRNSYRCDTLFVLMGVAIRLARKMGLHRDGTSLGLSPFETEMRRRLWFQLVHMDFRIADVMGARPSLDLLCGDTKPPLNVEDDDLYPDMVDPPPEREGITAITLCVMRCDLLETLRKFPASCPGGDLRWEVLSNPSIPFTKKENVINEIEDKWERRFMRYCDPSNSLHSYVSISIRSSICRLRIFAHNPRQFASSPAKASERERRMVFANATKLLEYVILVQKGSHGLDKYTWQLGSSFLWNTMLYVLIEMRHRKTGPEVDRSWQLIGSLFSYYPIVFEKFTGAVSAALGKWTLTVWDGYVAASKAEGLPEPVTPQYIDAIRRCRRPIIRSPSTTGDLVTDTGSTTLAPFSSGEVTSQIYDGNFSEFESLESYQSPDLLSFEMDPNQWEQWEQLLAEQSGSTRIDYI
ncbi:putative C6 transcription factor [Annulohypoxylon maeteangense]|uniref:putative C6 transcription factor n=1 Tax=Annulohypoxylon maeteangense TaxID=1927788 RepID=UPI0020073ECE|nr:putative C6 transcription factor [Annulohypoxylon maeteangense]KAI0880030.1 putative C6 transcription factor [Annulohypoxylon maeteangense]